MAKPWHRQWHHTRPVASWQRLPWQPSKHLHYVVVGNRRQCSVRRQTSDRHFPPSFPASFDNVASDAVLITPASMHFSFVYCVQRCYAPTVCFRLPSFFLLSWVVYCFYRRCLFAESTLSATVTAYYAYIAGLYTREWVVGLLRRLTPAAQLSSLSCCKPHPTMKNSHKTNNSQCGSSIHPL